MDASIAHLTSWSEATRGDVPLPLTGPSVTLSPLPGPPTVFVFGGKIVAQRRLTADMWSMDLSTRTWTRIDAGPGPGPRYFHSMDVYKLVCFGGMSDADVLAVHNDIWFFDCRARRWLPPPAPATAQEPALVPLARYAHLSAVSRGQLIVSGGQHSDNSWVYEINVYDLRRRAWIARTAQPEAGGLHSKGAYRSVAASSKLRVVSSESSTVQSYSIEEEGEGGDIWTYSNYDFAKVRRELEVFCPQPATGSLSDKYAAPPTHAIRDASPHMRGQPQPPGLRFPTGGIIGNSFVLCGLYLASSSAAFSVWALDLDTLLWRHLEPQVLLTGSWNRAVFMPDSACLLVLGNAQSDLAADYGKRAVNFDHVAVVHLETYGIYRPPLLESPVKAQQVGLAMFDDKLESDFDVVCEDGRKVKCSRRVLSERWPWFAEESATLSGRAAGIARDATSVDINDTLLGSFTPARLTPTSLNLAEPFPVCVALVQYFYTLALSTPLQNRAPVLSALLFLSKQYKLERLNKLVVHALHTRLEPSLAVGIYEIATLAKEQNLQARALNMIHAVKSGAQSTRGHRGPGAAQSTSGAPPGANGGAVSGSGSNLNLGAALSSFPAPPSQTPQSGNSPTDDDSAQAPHRRARADSLTVPADVIAAQPEPEDDAHDPVDVSDAHDIDQLLAALDMDAHVASTASRSIDPPTPVTPTLMIPPRSALRPPRPPPVYALPSVPPYAAPPAGRARSGSTYSDDDTRPPSPTSSVATSAFPGTPADSIRDSCLLSRDFSGYPMDSRSLSNRSGPNLPSLPELSPPLYPFDAHMDKLLPHPPADVPRTPSSTRTAPPPLTPSTPATSTAAATVGRQYKGSLAYRPSFASSSSSGSSSSISLGAYAAMAAGIGQVALPTPELPTKSGRTADYDTGTIMSASSRTEDDMSTMSLRRTDTGTFSNNSGSTGASSKRVEKEMRKAAALTQKEAKRAESQAKFEAMRAEQMKRMAISRAEAQRVAEVAVKEREAALVAKATQPPQQKTKLGRFGAKFADSVLFPSGGGNNSMF